MDASADEKLARRLIETGVMTAAEVESLRVQCIGELDGQVHRIPLFRLLLDHKLVTPDQLNRLLAADDSAPAGLSAGTRSSDSLAAPAPVPASGVPPATAIRRDVFEDTDVTPESMQKFSFTPRMPASGPAGRTSAAEDTNVTPEYLRQLAFPASLPAGSPDLVAAPDPAGGTTLTGIRFGRYDIVSEIARGAMGVVYQAFDPSLRRLVALKVMLASDPTPEMTRRFEKEAKMAARVQHPNLVAVHDVGEVDGKLYYTMDLIEGESLKTILRRTPELPPPVALRIAREACRGLHAAHEQNLVHRDVKPANIMITPHEKREPPRRAGDTGTWLQVGDERHATYRVTVTDFGIAKDVTSQTQITRAGSLIGTPAYMSPEQASQPERIGPASDVYSLGVVLYQMLVGRLPFPETEPLLQLASLLTQEPPRLRRLSPGLHADLETIVEKAMMKDPERRYPHAGEFADDIDRYVSGEVIQARPVTPVYRAWHFARRNRAVVLAASAGLAVALAVSLYFTAWPSFRDWRREVAAAEARAAREADARERSARAEALLTAGHADEAATEARALIAKHAEAHARGEAVRVPDAHDLLARVHAQKGEAPLALLERYRAQRAALGSPGGEEFVLRAVRETFEQRRTDEARTMATRLLRTARDPTVRAAAEYWAGRAAESLLEFAEGMRHLARALADRALPADLRPAAEQHREFCRLFARTYPAVPRPAPPNYDVDGDGTLDTVTLKDDRLEVVFHRPGGDVEAAPFPLAERHWIVNCIPLLDARHPTLAIGTATIGRTGAVRCLRWNGEKLIEVGVCATQGLPFGFVAADLDGDGRNEFAYTASQNDSDGTVFVARWDEEHKSFTPLGSQSLGGRCVQLYPVDFDGDGKEEVAACYGEWGGYGFRVFRLDPTKGLVLAKRTTLGVPHGLQKIERPGRPPRFLFGVGWDQTMTYPLRRIFGEEAFLRDYAPVGAYLLTPRADFGFDRRTLIALDPKEGYAGSCRIARVTQGGKTFYWIQVLYPEPERPGEIHVFVGDEDPAPLAVLTMPPKVQLAGTGNADEDPDIELYLYTPRGQMVYDAADGAAEVPEGPDAAAGSGASLARHPLVEFAEDAERAGLAEEALSAWREAANAVASRAEALEAVRGELRCLGALGRAAELSECARRRADLVPALEGDVLDAATKILEAGNHWAEAREVAERRAHSTSLPRADYGEAVGHEARLAALAKMGPPLRLVGKDATALDWVATHPFVGRIEIDGSWTVMIASGAPDSLCAPVSLPGDALHSAVLLRTERLDWASGAFVGVGVEQAAPRLWASPMHGVTFYARGGGDFPMHYILADQWEPRGNGTLWQVSESGTRWQQPIRFEWTALVAKNLFSASVWQAPDAAPFERTGPARVIEVDRVMAGFAHASQDPRGYWTVLRVERFDVQGMADDVQPRRYVPRTALEHMFRANGQWIAGDRGAARSLYDQAIALADLDRVRNQAAKAAGLPETPDDGDFRVDVDARLYRGLLRAAGDDAAGAAADLKDAWALSADRIRRLIPRIALPLLDRPKEAAALRAFWKELAGSPHGKEGLQALKQRTLEAVEDNEESARLLMAELRLVQRVAVTGADPAGAGTHAGLLRDDVLVDADGRPMHAQDDWESARAAARKAGRKSVALRVSRGGVVLPLELPADGDLGIRITAGTQWKLEGD